MHQLSTVLISSQAIGNSVHDLVATCRVVQSHDADTHVNELTGTEHMVIIVTLKDGSKWLTDVGFGGQVPRRPLRIDQLDLDPEEDSRTYGEPVVQAIKPALSQSICGLLLPSHSMGGFGSKASS